MSLARGCPPGSSTQIRYAKGTPEVSSVADGPLLHNKGGSFLGGCALLGVLSIVFTGMSRDAKSQMPAPP
ncbi:hypothetical protein D3C87_1580090 [compost metagenome]